MDGLIGYVYQVKQVIYNQECSFFYFVFGDFADDDFICIC